jgi:cutinase
MHGAAKALPQNVVDKIAGIALFGDTQNKQSGGHIKGLPESKSKVFCIQGDGVCGGALAVNGQHMAYPNSPKLKEGADWLLANIKAMKAAGPVSAQAPPAAAPAAPPAAEPAMDGMAGMDGM